MAYNISHVIFYEDEFLFKLNQIYSLGSIWK